jgi:RNA polymerase sigma-70 factor (family 1)
LIQVILAEYFYPSKTYSLTMADTIENDIISAFNNGDEKAFLRIYSFYKEKLTAFSIKFIKCPELAKDIVQEVFIVLLESGSKFNTQASLQSFLYTVTKHKVIDHFRKASSDTKLKEQILYYIEKEQNSPENLVIDSEYQTFFQEALIRLPAQKRLIYQLSRVENFTYEEIAIRLGLSKNTVRNHMAEATHMIKNYLLVSADILLVLAWFIIYFSPQLSFI